jgi:hypothetical protein
MDAVQAGTHSLGDSRGQRQRKCVNVPFTFGQRSAEACSLARRAVIMTHAAGERRLYFDHFLPLNPPSSIAQ